MAKHASPLKEERKSARRRVRNLYHRSYMMREIKAFLAAVNQKNVEKAKELLPHALARIQHTASRGVIHRNQAARRVSRLVRRFNAFLKAQESTAA